MNATDMPAISTLGKILTVVIMSTLVACATSPTGRKQFMIVSEDRAISASKEAYLSQMSQLSKEGKLVKNPKVLQRVDDITGKLIAQAILLRPETKDWQWSVEVIDDPETINAWCMAGGRMAVYTGLIQKIDPTDDELAQVMGHEISHALANHTAERMSVAMGTTVLAVGVGVASDKPVLAMGAAAAAAQLAISLPNSRTSEAEADQIGIELAAKAGYNPEAAVTLWKKMESAGGSGPPAFLSTHPSPGQRQEKLAALVPQMMPYYEAAKDPPVYQLARTDLGALPGSGGAQPALRR
jgi:predicted Zn-dependent protease